MPSDRFLRPAIVGVTVGGLALRFVYVLAAKRDQPVLGDAIYYTAQAKTLAEGHGFTHPFFGGPAADHPPLTSLAMAPVAFVTDSITAQRLAMSVLGAVVVLAIAYVAHLVAGPRAGLVAAVIAALYPNLWMNDALVMSDTLTALLVAALLIGVLRWRAEPSLPWVVAIGMAAGLGTLARAEMPLVVVLVVVPVVLSVSELRTQLKVRHLLVAAAVSLLVVSPWVVRNLLVFEHPVVLSTNDGLTLVGANCDSTYYGGGVGFWDLRCAPPEPGDQSEVSSAYRTIAVDYVRDHLGRVPVVVAARVGRVWGVYRPSDMVYLNQGEGRERWASRLGMWSYDVLLPLAGLGCWLLRRRGFGPRGLWPLLAPFVAVTIVAAAFYGIVRFRVPAEVSIVVLASVSVAAGIDRLTNRAALPAPAE